MKVTKNRNFAVWLQRAHRHNGRNFPAVVITGVKEVIGIPIGSVAKNKAVVSYRPIRIIT